MTEIILETARLRLVPYRMDHLDGLHAMSSDPRVVRYLGGVTKTLEETVAAIECQMGRWEAHGFGWWTFFRISTGEIIGAGCIQYLAGIVGSPLEIGWRLRPDHWGQGFATEAARTMAAFAFDQLKAPELLAVAHPENIASRRVMERLGMRYRGIERWYETDAATYEIGAAEWRERQAANEG
ncbi:N-acetyltransferase [Aliidongia dinghuensis]|uniref:N-acetyltransferase n=1 Tax=Aliidongia dinghuensis TaxID=1867774 RepID=A0A8J2YPN2_9PROT|nr:GNAT family N-acetyltransferase [Aliidongia dinghuensis]GGF00584.1 N-acetyltransferase [Aliidongia dinghuensis]